MEENDLKSKHWEFYNPMFSTEHNLDMAVGAIEFRDKVIKNLRNQISELRELKETVDELDQFISDSFEAHPNLDIDVEMIRSLKQK